MGDMYKTMSKMRGRLHEALQFPDMPPIFSPVMSIYKDVGSEASYQEMKAYQEMTGVTMSELEVSIVKDIGYVMRAVKNGSNTQQILEAFGYG